MRCLVVLAFVVLAAADTRAQSEPPLDANVALQVSIVGGDRSFHIGERIPIQLAFSTAIGDRYQVNMATYDRSGRMEYEHFRVSPSNGSVDPLAKRLVGMTGGVTSHRFLALEPWTIQLNVNDWVRFTRPGKYRLEITSGRVEVKDPSTARGTSSIVVAGNPITLTIIPSTAAWRKATLDRAVAVLNQPAPPKPPADAHYQARSQALDTLRFLGTPDATRELVNCLRGDDPFGNRDSICILGLISAPAPAIARRALEAALVHPDRPITGRFLYALQMVSDDRRNAIRWRHNQQQALEKLVAALPKKRGRALSVSLATAVNEAWNSVPLSTGTTEALVRQLIERFDQLPVELQSALLDSRWDKIGRPAMLPILRRYALAPDNRLNPDSPSGYAAQRLSASALQHWYELDPAGARPAIIAEIMRPNTRYGARTLGLLPDHTLPEVDSSLAEQLTTSDSLDQSARVASLIARYATGAILTPVLATLDPRIGTWACDVQNPILAYVLRVNPPLARPLIERALTARGDGFTACYHDLLSSIAGIHYDAVLEDLAIGGLNDPDHGVVRSGATVLGEFGSRRAESVLLEHYRKWCETWSGRESELNPAFADGQPQQDAIAEGTYLLHALTTGRSWLTDASKLESLLSITRSARLRQALNAQLNPWRSPPLIIMLSNRSGSPAIEARVAQYEFRSMQALEDKLSQFPVGMRFALRLSEPDSPARRLSEATLRAFLSDHGMVVVDAQ